MIDPELDALPDDAACYVPGVGEVTIGNVRGPAMSDMEKILHAEHIERKMTIRMWGWIVTHPAENPWKDRTSAFWRSVGSWEKWHDDDGSFRIPHHLARGHRS